MPDITLKNDDKSISLQKKTQNITIQHTTAPYIVKSNDYNDLLNKPDLSVYATKIYVDTELAGKAEKVHVHTISNVTGLQSALDSKAEQVHNHTISDVTGLQSALDSKSATNHTHTAANVTDFDTEVSNNTDVAANTAARHTHANKTLLDTYSQTEVNLADAVAKKHSHTNSAVLDATTASFTTADETKLDGIAAGATANSSDATLLARANHTGTQSADTITDGTTNKTYTATEKTKLAGIATGAQVNTVTSVNTRTGVVVLDADDISDAATTNKFVTAAEKTKLSNLSGTNTGDNLIIGTATPTPSIGAQVLWLDTTGGNITLNLVTGE